MSSLAGTLQITAVPSMYLWILAMYGHLLWLLGIGEKKPYGY